MFRRWLACLHPMRGWPLDCEICTLASLPKGSCSAPKPCGLTLAGDPQAPVGSSPLAFPVQSFPGLPGRLLRRPERSTLSMRPRPRAAAGRPFLSPGFRYRPRTGVTVKKMDSAPSSCARSGLIGLASASKIHIGIHPSLALLLPYLRLSPRDLPSNHAVTIKVEEGDLGSSHCD